MQDRQAGIDGDGGYHCHTIVEVVSHRCRVVTQALADLGVRYVVEVASQRDAAGHIIYDCQALVAAIGETLALPVVARGRPEWALAEDGGHEEGEGGSSY
jgi:hypothetical protein